MKRQEKSEQKRIARERIKRLFSLADEAKEQARADRCVQLARKIAMRYNVRLPPELKRRVCKGCGSYLVPGRNARVRTSRDRGTVVTCLKCGHVIRYPHRKGFK